MPKTYNEIYIDARKQLKETGVSSYSLEARLLLAFAARKTRDELLRSMNLYTSEDVEEKVQLMVRRRLNGEPVAYITGNWEFFGLPMMVSPDVLIPRVDTEVLAETAIESLRGRIMDARVLDLCAGSGCVGCAVASELPATRVLLVDNSARALAVAKQNVLKNKLNPRVTCMEADVLNVPPMMIGSFDLVVCNPPYIPTSELSGLDASVRNYEPVEALDGGTDGLDFYRAVLKNWRGVVRPDGAIMFEVGAGQAEDVSLLMRVAGFKNILAVKDTLGIERVVCGNA